MSYATSNGHQRKRLFEQVVGWVEGEIRTGALKPGDRLPSERLLVAQFGISRTAVREALRSLAAHGLIESHVGRGTFVAEPALQILSNKLHLFTRPTADELGEALQHITGTLALLAAARRTEPDLEKLRLLVEGKDNEAPADAFVRVLGEAAQNKLLSTLAMVLLRMPRPSTASGAITPDFGQVVACIAAQDEEGARTAFWTGCIANN